jgi:hypothetical protein
MNRFVYIDEAGFRLHITHKYGRAPRGRRAYQRVPYNPGPHFFLLIVALDKTGVLGLLLQTTRLQPRNIHEFFFLLTMLFPVINERRRVIVMDNAQFSQDEYGEECRCCRWPHSSLPPNVYLVIIAGYSISP